MNTLHWELSVLCRAVEFHNLSSAASHVGISQPQLSRITAKIESELGIVLLDRTVRRQSTWTPEARKLAEIYLRSVRGLEAEVAGLVGRSRTTRLAVGCLEGLIEHAAAVCHAVLKKYGLHTLELDVQDIGTLETLFLNGSLDVIYTCREIVRRKPKYTRIVAGQVLESFDAKDEIVVRSHYEHAAIPVKRYAQPDYKALILSNSLSVRKHWLERYGGKGVVPTRPKRRDPKSSHEAPVFLFAADKLEPELWKLIESLSLKP